MEEKRCWAKVEPFVADPDHRPSRAPGIFPAWRLSISVKASGANNPQTPEENPVPSITVKERASIETPEDVEAVTGCYLDRAHTRRMATPRISRGHIPERRSANLAVF